MNRLPSIISSILALLVILTSVQASPAHAGGSSCVDPNTIGGSGLWVEMTPPGSLNHYYIYSEGHNGSPIMTTPLSGQLTLRRGPDSVPMPPGKITRGHDLAYRCGPNYPAPVVPTYGTTAWVAAYMSEYDSAWQVLRTNEYGQPIAWYIQVPAGQPTRLIMKGSALGRLFSNFGELVVLGTEGYVSYAEYQADTSAIPTPTPTMTATVIPTNTSTATPTPRATHTSTPTPTSTSTPPQAPAQVPLVKMDSRKENGRLFVRVMLTDPSNRFKGTGIQFIRKDNGEVHNLVVRNPGGTIGVPEPFASFEVTRTRPGEAVTIRFVVVTEKGDHSTFVGHGPNPF